MSQLLTRFLKRLGPLAAYVATLGGVFALLLNEQGRLWAARFGSGAIYALGVVCGLILAVLLGMIWVSVAGPIQEWLLEKFWDPLMTAKVGPDSAKTDRIPAEGPLGIIVSDLHIDTWEYAKSGVVSERQTRFLGLLAEIKSNPRIDSFYLNGDLMDAPPHPNDNKPEPLMLRLSESLATEQGVLLKQYHNILNPLFHLTASKNDSENEPPPVRRAIFQTGNHDIGVSGLRYVQPNMPDYLPGVQAAWNPSLLLLTDAEGAKYAHAVYLEHGHYWDPFLWLYMRYALMDILRSGHHKREAQLVSAMQRRGKVGMGKQTIVPDAHLLPAPPPGSSSNHFAAMQRGGGEWFVRMRYRQAARRIFREFRREDIGDVPVEQKHVKHGLKDIRTIVVGHTHCPDRYVFPGGHVYINSGDWSGHTRHCAYCVIDPDGSVRGPFQWESKAKAEFQTDTAQAPIEAAAAGV